MSVEAIDTNMKLLAGLPIYVGDIPIKPFTLREVAEIGYLDFQGNINLLSMTVDDMIEAIDDFELHATLKATRHQFDILDFYAISDGMRDVLRECLAMVFRTENIEFDLQNIEGPHITIDNKYIINKENFPKIAEVIDMQNNPKVGQKEEQDFNPSNDLAKEIAEKLKKAQEKVRKTKAMNSDGEGLLLDDVISAVSAMSNNTNKLDIWDYTLYQLFDEFARLNKIDNYRLQIQASMWSSDIEIEHWSEPL